MHPFRTLSLLLLLLVTAVVARGQVLEDYPEHYRLVRLDAFERILPSFPTDSALTEPTTVGLRRDSLGRVVELSLFYFGNIDTRGSWSTMSIEWVPFDTIQSTLERRTFRLAGMPVSFGPAYAQELLWRNDGTPVRRRLVDRDMKEINGMAGVASTILLPAGEGRWMQQWHVAGGKMRFGAGFDSPLAPFAATTNDAWFRIFAVDSLGRLVEERTLGFDKRPTPYPGGEIVRRYRSNQGGLPLEVSYHGADGSAMADNNGIARILWEYDDFGRPIEWRSFDIDGNPRGGADGVARRVWHWRRYDGQLVGEEAFAADGSKVGSTSEGG